MPRRAMRFIGQGRMMPEPTPIERDAPHPEDAIVTDAKHFLRTYLTEHGWTLDARCKKHETFKKNRNGEMYQVKFMPRVVNFDKGIKRNTWQGRRTEWRMINQARYDYFDDISKVIQFLNRLPTPSSFVMTQEDKENETYLRRLGIRT